MIEGRWLYLGIAAIGLYFWYFMDLKSGAEFALGLYIVEDIHWEIVRRFGEERRHD